MRTLILFLSGCVALGVTAQATHELSAVDYEFTPATLNIDAGDSIHVTLGTDHTCTEVDEATWNANGETSNGGFNFGDDTPNPGSEHTFSLDVPGTYWYVCQPHVADHGMKGIIHVGPTGIDEVAGPPMFELAPNPASNEVRLVLMSGTPQRFVLLYDARGRNVMSTDLRGTPILDVGWLQPGRFTVLTTDKDGIPLARRELLIGR